MPRAVCDRLCLPENFAVKKKREGVLSLVSEGSVKAVRVTGVSHNDGLRCLRVGVSDDAKQSRQTDSRCEAFHGSSLLVVFEGAGPAGGNRKINADSAPDYGRARVRRQAERE